jgi:hypothetical protein
VRYGRDGFVRIEAKDIAVPEGKYTYYHAHPVNLDGFLLADDDPPELTFDYAEGRAQLHLYRVYSKGRMRNVWAGRCNQCSQDFYWLAPEDKVVRRDGRLDNPTWTPIKDKESG